MRAQNIFSRRNFLIFLFFFSESILFFIYLLIYIILQLGVLIKYIIQNPWYFLSMKESSQGSSRIYLQDGLFSGF